MKYSKYGDPEKKMSWYTVDSRYLDLAYLE